MHLTISFLFALLTSTFILVFYRVAHTVQDRLYDDSISDSLQFITFLFSSASHPLIFSVLHPDEKKNRINIGCVTESLPVMNRMWFLIAIKNTLNKYSNT